MKMKENLKFLLVALLLIIPNIVKASYIAPIQATFDVVVINNSGINYYDYDENNNKIDKHFNKGDIFTVISKNCDDCNTYIIEYNGERNFIETLNGTKLINDRIIPHEGDDNIIAISTNNEALIYAENGVDIRRGPNEVYEKVDHLKKGTRIKYTYYYSDGGITHIYVDNNGIRGWIDITKSKVLI